MNSLASQHHSPQQSSSSHRIPSDADYKRIVAASCNILEQVSCLLTHRLPTFSQPSSFRLHLLLFVKFSVLIVQKATATATCFLLCSTLRPLRIRLVVAIMSTSVVVLIIAFFFSALHPLHLYSVHFWRRFITLIIRNHPYTQ